ncbi:MAG: fused MFS/spermidine synthase [Planctomycetota bacterium]
MHLIMLYCTSIICGFCMMALEMIGGRFLQPVFGTGIDVWSAIITVFILSLSIGYVLGGRIADRYRTNLALAWVILIAGIFYLILPIYARPLIMAMGGALHASGGGGVLIAALVLFFFPSLLLGCVSPMLVKLVFDDPSRVGRITGTLYAIGSVGNVLGILVSTYLMLRFFQLNSNMLGMGLTLGLTALAHFAIRITSAAREDGIVPDGSETVAPVPANTAEAV